MLMLAVSAAVVGLIHSLSPGHWLPVVLIARARHWPWSRAVMGALVTASGHVVVSTLIGVISIYLGSKLLPERMIESYGGLILMTFGAFYALQAYFRHSSCHGHTHHGPDPESPQGQKTPYFFLFSVGLSPCVAVLPVFLAASALGVISIVTTLVAFSLGVAAALVGATWVVSKGLVKLDHPIFEHFGDVITGVAVAAMGLILFFFPI